MIFLRVGGCLAEAGGHASDLPRLFYGRKRVCDKAALARFQPGGTPRGYPGWFSVGKSVIVALALFRLLH